MPLVTVDHLTIRYRGPALLDEVQFHIDAGERIGLLGRNGAGKTTLMKCISGIVEPDSGEVQVGPGVRVAMLSQDVPDHPDQSVFEVVRDGWPRDLLATEEPWKVDQLVEQMLSRMDLEEDRPFSILSTGMKRRVLLARALVVKPDLLLLDEPTNHLDIDSIGWLEEFLLAARCSLLFVTHDRMFLRRLANRILEVDRGRIFDWSCDYEQFLKRKAETLAAEEKQQALFDKRLAQEEAWIRQGIKARRTRNEGRVRALEALRETRRQRREQVGTSKLQIQEAQRSGRMVIRARDITVAHESQPPLFEDFSTTIMRGDKVGIIGPNGVGKTTLLKTLLRQREPTDGTVEHGTKLEFAYFDQRRDQLDLDATVEENVGQGSDAIEIQGVRKHVLGYLQDFLFPPDRARTQVKFLSGGEKNRILLARLFAQPANLIVMDEPTNDLDAETLELLEEKLIDYSGTLLMVSHDREFLNQVVTSTIVFEPWGLREYVGGYDDWQRQRQPPAESVETSSAGGNTNRGENAAPDKSRGGKKRERRLSYHEQRELDGLPEQIEALEAEREQWHGRMGDPDFYQRSGDEIATDQAEFERLEAAIQAAYQRWETLDQIAAGQDNR